MPGGIDYSKWDKIDYGSDDEDSSVNEEAPAVTRLDESSSVTFSSNGVSIAPSPTIQKEKEISSKPPVQNDSSISKNVKKRKICTKNGSSYVDPKSGNEILWSQDRNEVNISIIYDCNTIASKDIRVKIHGALSYQDRFSAVGTENIIDGVEGSKGKLIVTAKGCDEPLLQGYTGYPVYLPQDEEEIDWEIDVTDSNMKMIRITLLKAVPMQGLTVWWSRPLIHFPEIDVVSGIEGRTSSNSNKDKHDQWKQSWEEAHRMFKEKIKNKEKQII